MKPIIIDMRDMSDSKEVYEARPNPLLARFIYLILIMMVVALVWMCFCKIDIVVKGTGTVCTAEEVATVTNQVAGTIIERVIDDGQTVEKGDVLYVVSHENLVLEMTSLENQLSDYKEKEEILLAYEGWLEEREDFSEGLMGNSYYSEISSRKLLVEIAEESTLQAYAGELSAYGAKLSANTAMTDYYKDAIEKSRQLIEAIKAGSNTFSMENSYYWNYMDNFLARYQDIAIQYDNKIKELQRQSDMASQTIEKLEAEKQDLLALSQSGTENFSTVSGSDSAMVSRVSIQQQIQDIETQIIAQREAKEVADNSVEDYNTQKNSALSAYEKENLAAIESNILNYIQNLVVYEGTQLEYSNGQTTLMDQGTGVELENLVTQEKHSVAGELEACRQSQFQLNQQIESLRRNIENATVRASIGGTVNFAEDLVEGDYIGIGTQALSIIPNAETDAFIVKCYIENKDIAKIDQGMNVTYEIAAYPSREYGTMQGEVTFVSADLKVNNSGSAYYVVETSMNAGPIRNRMGEEAALKVGMLCETRIVIEQKSVLEVLIEKVFHLVK